MPDLPSSDFFSSLLEHNDDIARRVGLGARAGRHHTGRVVLFHDQRPGARAETDAAGNIVIVL